MDTVVLISCVSKKATQKAQAKDLYISPLFRMNLAYARSLRPEKIFILSARYGAIDLEEEIEPYEQTLNTMRLQEVERWAEKVIDQIQGKIDFENDKVVFLAGERYRRFLMPLFKNASVPMQGLGIGRQLQYLKHALEHTK